MKKVLCCVAMLCAVLSSGCSDNGGGGGGDDEQFSGDCALKIINGSTCPGGKGPVALVELYRGGEKIGICTGSFLSGDRVLTAAHCFAETGANAVDVWSGGRRVRGANVNIHPRYSEQERISRYDAAIIELSEFVDTPTLPLLLSEDAAPGMRLNVAGFGVDENGHSAADTDPARALKRGEMIVGALFQGFILALFDDTDSGICLGDSGGPAIVLTRAGTPGLIGVANAVGGPDLEHVGKCEANTVSIFTNVQDAAVTDWILEHAPGAGTI